MRRIGVILFIARAGMERVAQLGPYGLFVFGIAFVGRGSAPLWRQAAAALAAIAVSELVVDPRVFVQLKRRLRRIR